MPKAILGGEKLTQIDVVPHTGVASTLVQIRSSLVRCTHRYRMVQLCPSQPNGRSGFERWPFRATVLSHERKVNGDGPQHGTPATSLTSVHRRDKKLLCGQHDRHGLESETRDNLF